MLIIIAIAIFIYGMSIYDKDPKTGGFICFVAVFVFLFGAVPDPVPGVEYGETCHLDQAGFEVCE
jgi:hypothetical protein